MANPISVNYMQRASVEHKERIREFYRDVLDWELNEIKATLDIFSSSGGSGVWPGEPCT